MCRHIDPGETANSILTKAMEIAAGKRIDVFVQIHDPDCLDRRKEQLYCGLSPKE